VDYIQGLVDVLAGKPLDEVPGHVRAADAPLSTPGIDDRLGWKSSFLACCGVTLRSSWMRCAGAGRVGRSPGAERHEPAWRLANRCSNPAAAQLGTGRRSQPAHLGQLHRPRLSAYLAAWNWVTHTFGPVRTADDELKAWAVRIPCHDGRDPSAACYRHRGGLPRKQAGRELRVHRPETLT
jgi:hypothetical protein